MTPIRIPKSVEDAARRLGIDPSSLPEMVRCSTPFSHPRGNRRFEGYMLWVEDGVLHAIERMETDPVKIRHRERQHERQQRRDERRELEMKRGDGKPLIDLTR